ncbi:putative aldehyde oxidase Art an 7 [Bidens hawaiensis]|uniref:putative aldehyde oxidase Art an 7 n=1 Tax=Bidens hawaiensis TaxID=980011 RepID=UPI00404A54D9
MAPPPSSASISRVILALFFAFSITTAGPHHGMGQRKHGKGHTIVPVPVVIPHGDPAVVPPGDPALVPPGDPSHVVPPGTSADVPPEISDGTVPHGDPAVVPPGGTPTVVPHGEPAVVPSVVPPAEIPPGAPLDENDFETDFKGSWAIDNPNVGVAAMQFQLMPNNKAVWFDTTSLGPSARELGPPGNCPKSPEMNFKPDCYAHAIAYDIETGESRTVYMDGEPWCSSGHLWPTGDLVATGGTRGGIKSVRMLSMNDPNANFVEKKNILADNRWYSSNQVLEDGSAVVVGGRNSFSYDIVPPNKLEFPSQKFNLKFLQETTVPKRPGPGMYIENNLYPFLFLIPDGNVFLFANDRGIIFHPSTGAIVRNFPKLPGGARNYPASGMAALLPLTVTTGDIHTEVVICGGNSQEAYQSVDSKHTKERVFMPALRDCHRLVLSDHASTWVKEQDMPSGRCMGDLLHLPTGDLLMINGAQKGVAGWENAIDPNFTPILYTPHKPMGQRFKEMVPTNIARMYHSVSALMPDGKILVAGSNPHSKYLLKAEYPTELRVEKFSPHYLDPALAGHRPVITPEGTDKVLKYGKEFKINVKFSGQVNDKNVKVTLVYPPFTTHGFSMNQRLVVVPLKTVADGSITAVAPLSGKIAPPGYYMLFVNFRGVPSKAIWVHIE